MSHAKVFRIFSAILPFALIGAVLIATLCFPAEEETPNKTCVVRVWNIDTFEGGKGSRTSFLRSVGNGLGKQNGVYYLVTSYTKEGAEAAIKAGELPDCISFGVGFSAAAEFSLPLPYRFAGGEVGGECLAYPWCRGEYILFRREGKTDAAISVGGNNLPCVAAAYAGVGGAEMDSAAAYAGFLDGKYGVLLGTQRDRCRFAARGMQVEEEKLEGYCDLYQYFSVLSAEKKEACLALLNALLSEENRARLSELGMSAVGEEHTRTPCVFSDGDALSALARAARAGDTNYLEKFLKTT